MAHFKRTLTVSLREMAKVVRGVQSLAAIVALLTTRYQLHHAKMAQMVRVLLHNNPRALGWVPLGHDEFVTYRDAVDGVVIRVVPDQLAIDGEFVLREWLEPFVPDDVPVYIAHATQPCQPQGPDVLSLQNWYEMHDFNHGDHIVVEIRWRTRCELYLRVDRAASQHLSDTVLATQDVAHQLQQRWQSAHDIDALYTHVLAMYAVAPWRNVYPAMPWQYILNAQSSAPVIVSRLELLRMRIHELQQALRQRRAKDSEHGLWDGIALRYSAIRMFIDTRFDDDATQRLTPVDTRLDHSFAIDEAIARGVYDVQYVDDDVDDHDEDWSVDDELSTEESYTAALQSGNDEDDDGDDAPLWSDDDIDSDTFVALFANRHPALRTWSVQLLAALSDTERRMMIRAESDDDHNAILSAAMQRLLPTMPQLMHTLRIIPMPQIDTTLGGQTYAAFEQAEHHAAQFTPKPDTDVPVHDIDRTIDGDAIFIIELSLRDSYTEIRAYEQWLTLHQPRTGSLQKRMQTLREWALFLAQYYTTSLHDATYAMLDEYFFFHYPRHTASASLRTIRARIGYVRDYYTYREILGDTRMHAAAQAIYDCRHQAADVLDVLLRIQQYPHVMTALVVHLFAPYTV